MDGRARLAELAKPLISQLPEGFYRELLMQQLAETVGLSVAKTEALIGRQATTKSPRASRPTSTRRQAPTGSGKPSVVRRAVSLLLHTPKAALNLDPTELAGIDRPGVDLLHDLIETVHDEPDISTAGLLERWRHHEQGRHLGKLAAAEIPVGEDFDPAAELADCLRQLRTAARRDRIEYLIEKERLGALSPEQKQELREHLQESGRRG